MLFLEVGLEPVREVKKPSIPLMLPHLHLEFAKELPPLPLLGEVLPLVWSIILPYFSISRYFSGAIATFSRRWNGWEGRARSATREW